MQFHISTGQFDLFFFYGIKNQFVIFDSQIISHEGMHDRAADINRLLNLITDYLKIRVMGAF